MYIVDEMLTVLAQPNHQDNLDAILTLSKQGLTPSVNALITVASGKHRKSPFIRIREHVLERILAIEELSKQDSKVAELYVLQLGLASAEYDSFEIFTCKYLKAPIYSYGVVPINIGTGIFDGTNFLPQTEDGSRIHTAIQRVKKITGTAEITTAKVEKSIQRLLYKKASLIQQVDAVIDLAESNSPRALLFLKWFYTPQQVESPSFFFDDYIHTAGPLRQALTHVYFCQRGTQMEFEDFRAPLHYQEMHDLMKYAIANLEKDLWFKRPLQSNIIAFPRVKTA